MTFVSFPFAHGVLAVVTARDWAIAGALLGGAIVATLILRQIVHQLTRTLKFQSYLTTLITRFVGTIIILVAAVYALRQLEVEVGPLLGALGIGGFVIALSLQHVLVNLVGSVLLHARRPFRRGDQIHSNGFSGTVIDITTRAVVLVSFDGERLYLPNQLVLEQPIRNQTAEGYRRTIVPFEVSYEADLRVTQLVLTTAIRAIDGLQDTQPADVIVTGFAESGVSLSARFWHPAEELTARWLTSEVAIAIRETLAAENITIPFPQRVLHFPEAMPVDANGVIEDLDGTARPKHP